MSISTWLTPVRRLALLSAAILLAAGVTFAQDANGASQIVASDSYSSSSAGIPEVDFSVVLPAGGGQYDNRSATNSNAGWRGRLAFEVGGGFNTPTNDSSPYIKWGGNFTVGAGMHLSKMASLLIDYQFLRNGLPDAIVAQTGASGGNVNLWGITLNPVVNLIPNSNNSLYVTGGGGFYRKVTNFTDPQPYQYCDYYYGYCGVGYTNQTIGHFSSNQGGWSVGAGFSHRFAGMYNDGKMSVFAEARYLDVLTPGVYGQSANGLNPTTIGPDTKLIPVTFGVRF